MNVIMQGNVAFLPGSQSAVFFSKPSYSAFAGGGSSKANKGSRAVLPEIVKELKVAPWGSDNRFPQEVANQMDYCGVGKATLDWKAKALYGNGLFYGTIKDYDDTGKEVFEFARPGKYPEIDRFFRENNKLVRFYSEFNQDWVWFANCFPEMVLSGDGTKIAKWVHQESCDCRFKQMDNSGDINRVYISKLWGSTADQFVKLKPKEKVSGTSATQMPRLVDQKHLLELVSLDMYNAHEDLVEQTQRYKKLRNFILPVQYPSPNKTYYQLASWDGARLAGWVEIAAKIPTLMKALYEQGFNLKYHIEIPATYWTLKFGPETWTNFKPEEKEAKQRELLVEMDKFLKGADNAGKSFISFFDINRDGEEINRIKITTIDNKNNIDKELLASSAANSEIMFAMQVMPDLIGAGTPGARATNSAGSGSNLREGKLIYDAQLYVEREMILEPLLLTQKFNQWPEEVVFRFRDVVLTTTDKGKGTEKTVS